MKNILVTGGAGYIGSHIVKELLDQGYFPITIDNLSQGHRDAVLGGDFIGGDIGDATLLRSIFQKHAIDAVIHMAASSIVSESVANPKKYYQNNVVNGLNLLETMLEFNVKKIVFSSTAAVYGEPKEIPITEEHLCNPTNPYGWSKFMFEQVLKDFDKAYGLKYISLRYFNAAGAHPNGLLKERHSPETHLIPNILKATQEGRPVEIYGTDYPTPDGTCIRDYIHVCDLAKAHILSLKKLIHMSESSYYNLGNGAGVSVKEVIKAVENILRKEIPIKISNRRPGDPAVLIASSQKIEAELNWRSINKGIQTIISLSSNG